MEGIETIRPQQGFQMKFLSSKADIVIGGSAAGVGKTFSMLLEPLRHITTTKGYGGVIFRRTTPQIRNEGGLWDTSMSVYPFIGGNPRESTLEWVFDNGNKIKFAHLEHEKDKLSWQGSQIPFIGFDELTHFSESQFFYLLSRNRSFCGVSPYVRATCNPDPDSWVYDFVQWWIDQETGYPIPERDGVVRYFIKNGSNYIWGNTYDEVKEKAWYFLEEMVSQSDLTPKNFIKSLSFVSGSVYDNKKLLEKDPSYISNLLSQSEDVQAQLLKGNWKYVENEEDLYSHDDFSGVFDNVIDNSKGLSCITSDIAMEGSNKLIIGHWSGFLLDDIVIIDKNKGDKPIDKITELARKHNVQNRNISFDADGVGAYVDGFIRGARPFHGGAAVIPVKDPVSGKTIKENYKNLKTQCFYKSSEKVKVGKYSISKEVAETMYSKDMTVRQRFMYERRAIKRDKVDMDGKKCIKPKAFMKTLLNGDSPDLMDMFSQREFLELQKPNLITSI